MLAPVAQVHWTFRDETGSTTSMQLYVPSATSPAAALDAAAGLVARFNAISGCVVIEVSITYREIITPSSNPSQSANLYGVLLFETNTPDEYFIAAIPGLKTELLNPSPDELHINVEHSDVAALVSYITGGLFSNPFAFDVVSLAEAYTQQRLRSGLYIS